MSLRLARRVFLQWVGAPADKAGRIKVEDDLTVPGRPEIFAIGDTANITMPDGKPVPGPGDLQGWTSIVVTPEMVGRRVAIYTSIETKESGGGRRRPDQVNWCGQVLAAGGIAGFAKSAEEAQKIVDGYQPPWGA